MQKASGVATRTVLSLVCLLKFTHNHRKMECKQQNETFPYLVSLTHRSLLSRPYCEDTQNPLLSSKVI